MRLQREFTLGALAVTVLVLGLGPAGSPAFAAGPDPGINVTVTNPPSTPVPVTLQGTSSISGNVNVTNFPATQVTRDVLAPGQNPTTHTVVFNFSNANEPQVSPNVLTGQRFIVTYVSVVLFSNNAGFPLTSGDCLLRFVNLLRMFPLTKAFDRFFSASEQMFLVLNEGEQLSMRCDATGGVVAGNQANATVSGYFVPTP